MAGEPETTGTLKPLQITCTSADCANGLHCFQQTRKMVALHQQGRCRTCGVELIDWSCVHTRNPADVAYTFTALVDRKIKSPFALAGASAPAPPAGRHGAREAMRED